MKQNNSPKILLLCPNLDNTKPWDFTFTDHLGTSYIRAYLKEKGILASQLIYREPVDLNVLNSEILRQNIEIIGFTCYDSTYHIVKLISGKLKRMKPNLIILVGGITATFSDRFILENSPAVDICVRREGEYTVHELIKQINDGGDISNIDGITYRINGNIMRNPDRPLIRGQEIGAELDILPSPFLNDVVVPEDNFGLVTSRGCVYRCTYCNFSSMSNWVIRHHSVERVISELKRLSRAIHHVPIFDDTFTLDVARAKQICRRIIEEKLNLSFWCQTRADRVDRELLELMYQAGFKKLTFGLESAVPKVLKTVQKVRTKFADANDDLEPEKNFIRKVKENVNLAKEIGLDPEVNIIAGLPGATLEDDKETINFVKDLKVNSYVHHTLNIFPGTELFETHEQYGIRLKLSSIGLPYHTHYAYDVSKITEMDNSQNLLFKNTQVNLILRIITGSYKDTKDTNYPDILFKHCFPMTAEVINCLREFITMNSKIGFLCNRLNDETIRLNLKEMISHDISIIHCYSLELNESISESFSKYRILLNATDYSNTIGSFIFIPFHDYLCNSLNSLVTDSENRSKVIFVLNKACDIEDLVGLEKQRIQAPAFLENLFNFDFSFLDACRWLDCNCPVATFRRAFIEEDGSIIPCFCGKSIGKIGDTRQDFAEKSRRLWDKVKLERGCNNCVARDTCSKCIFPFPFSIEEFCLIKKKGAVFSNIIRLSKF